jgi:endonuclease IV
MGSSICPHISTFGNTDESFGAQALRIVHLVCYLGNHLGKGIQLGIERVAKAVNETLDKAETGCVLLLETGPRS